MNHLITSAVFIKVDKAVTEGKCELIYYIRFLIKEQCIPVGLLLEYARYFILLKLIVTTRIFILLKLFSILI